MALGLISAFSATLHPNLEREDGTVDWLDLEDEYERLRPKQRKNLEQLRRSPQGHIIRKAPTPRLRNSKTRLDLQTPTEVIPIQFPIGPSRSLTGRDFGLSQT
jgi:hypothetical protein